MTGLKGDLRARAAAVRALALDVDGVLTDGRLRYGADGEQVKVFHARDGLGLRLLMAEHIPVALVSGRGGDAVRRRAADLRIQHLYLDCHDKVAAVTHFAEALGLALEAVAFVGDDVLDLSAMRCCGLGVAVADAHPSVRAEAAWTTHARGGEGAVREVADALLEARGRLDACVERLLAPSGAVRGSLQ